MNRSFEGTAEVVRRRWSLVVGAAVLFVASLVLRRMGSPGWGVLVEQALAVALLVAFSSKAYRVRNRGTLKVDGGGLQLQGKLVAPRSIVVSAFLLSPEQPIVRIVRRRAPSLDVHLDSDGEARALLAALGFAIDQSIIRFSAWYGGRPTAVVVAVAAAGSLGVMTSGSLHNGGFSFPEVALFLGVLLLLGMRLFTRVEVGSDGILLRRLGNRAFLSYGRLSSASLRGRTIVLTLGSGSLLRLSTSQTQLAEAFVSRIEEARRAFPLADGAETDVRIDPGGRSVRRWVSDLRAMAKTRAYRDAGADPESLWRLLDNAGASPATRAGAALALSTLDQAACVRLRVAADACAEPKLRVALTRVAEGASDSELEEALAPLLESKS